jgi:hypothetical protein
MPPKKASNVKASALPSRAENPAVASGRSSTKEMYVITPADNPMAKASTRVSGLPVQAAIMPPRPVERPATSVRARAISMDDRSGIS